MLQLTKRTEYGLIAMVHLATPAPEPVSAREIAETYNVPRRLLAEVLKDLCREGLVESTRGAQGGYALAREAETITFKDVIEAIEGPVSLNVCVGDAGEAPDCCAQSPRCSMLWVWKEAQKRVMEVFATTTLAAVLQKRAVTPGVVGAATG